MGLVPTGVGDPPSSLTDDQGVRGLVACMQLATSRKAGHGLAEFVDRLMALPQGSTILVREWWSFERRVEGDAGLGSQARSQDTDLQDPALELVHVGPVARMCSGVHY